MNERIRTLMEKRAKALFDARALLNLADAEKRDLTSEEEQQYTGFDQEYDRLSGEIAREERVSAREAELRGSANGRENPQQLRPIGSNVEERSEATETREYRQSLMRYMAFGQNDGALRVDRRAENSELRSILGTSITGVGASGGILAPAAMERTLLDEIQKQNVVRALADVRASNSDVEMPYATAHTTAYLIAEGADFTASTPAFAKKTMKAFKVGALSYVTNEAMQDMFIDIEAWIRDDFGRAFAELEETHFLTGAGTTQPRGILTDATLGKTAASATAFTADELLDLVYSLNQKYRKVGSFLMNDSSLVKLRKLKSGDGQYIWQPSLLDGQPDRLLGHALYTSDTMPEMTTGNKAVLFGDFKKFRVLDRRGLYFQRLNEIAATSGQVGFLAYRRYDSMLIDTAAIKYIQMA